MFVGGNWILFLNLLFSVSTIMPNNIIVNRISNTIYYTYVLISQYLLLIIVFAFIVSVDTIQNSI